MTTQFQSQNILYPPVPPTMDEERTNSMISSEEPNSTINSENTTIDNEIFVPCNFDYVDCIRTRKMLINAWQAINKTEMWSFMRNDIDTYMFSNDKNVYIILNKMSELGYNLHSGSSFGLIMRQMQFIARYGEKKFREEYLKNK